HAAAAGAVAREAAARRAAAAPGAREISRRPSLAEGPRLSAAVLLRRERRALERNAVRAAGARLREVDAPQAPDRIGRQRRIAQQLREALPADRPRGGMRGRGADRSED